MAQGHLKLPGVQGIVPPEVPEFPFPSHPEGPLVHGLAPHPDALGGQPGVAEDRHTVGAHPAIASVVLLGLLSHTLFEHPLDLLGGEPQILQGLLLVPVGVIAEHVGLVQPVQQFLRNLLLKVHVLEIVQKTAVKPVEIRLTFHQHAPAQVVKTGKAGVVEVTPEGLHEGHPLGEGDLQPAAPEQI